MAAKKAAARTPQGYNKTKRILTRGLLGFAAMGLLNEGYSSYALACSSVAFLTLKEGTIWSVKNAKWMILTLITFYVSLWSTICMENAETFGVHKAYMVSAAVKMSGRTPELMWGYILALFVGSAFMTNNKEVIDHAQAVLQQQAGKLSQQTVSPSAGQTTLTTSSAAATATAAASTTNNRPPPMNPQYRAKVH